MHKHPFLIYYGYELSFNQLQDYEVVVLDPNHYEDVSSLKSEKYAYLSIGEVNPGRYYFEWAKKNSLLYKQNSHWGSYIIYFNETWREFLLHTVIPKILAKGYDGIMIDTAESLVHHTDTPKKEIIDFINQIKIEHPEILIMLNRTFEIVHEVNIDALLLESTISCYNFENSHFYLNPYEIYYKKNENVRLFSVDYWDEDDTTSIEHIYECAIKLGYKPLVTSMLLQSLPKNQLNDTLTKGVVNAI